MMKYPNDNPFVELWAIDFYLMKFISKNLDWYVQGQMIFRTLQFTRVINYDLTLKTLKAWWRIPWMMLFDLIWMPEDKISNMLISSHFYQRNIKQISIHSLSFTMVNWNKKRIDIMKYRTMQIPKQPLFQEQDSATQIFLILCAVVLWGQDPPPALPAAPRHALLDSTWAAAAGRRPGLALLVRRGATAPHQAGVSRCVHVPELCSTFFRCFFRDPCESYTC